MKFVSLNLQGVSENIFCQARRTHLVAVKDLQTHHCKKHGGRNQLVRNMFRLVDRQVRKGRRKAKETSRKQKNKETSDQSEQ